MKTKVRIACDLNVIDYCSKHLIFDFFSLFSRKLYGMENITALYINDKEENNLINEVGFLPGYSVYYLLTENPPVGMLPVECHSRLFHKQELEYIIEHDEEFDIEKLELHRERYDSYEIPEIIFGDYIHYDDKEVETVSDLGKYNNVESKMYNEFVISELDIGL